MPVVSTHTQRALIVGLAILATVLVSLMAAGRADAASNCPNTFRVLHNDHIGKLSLRKGNYRITVVNKNKLSCQKASNLFTKFLTDFDGNLPDGWIVKARQSAFVKTGNRQKGFSVRRIGSGDRGGGRHPARGEKICPGTFQVQHNDHIGRLELPKGPYTITVIKKRRISCERATNLFARFLQIPSGDLPGGWRLKAPSGTFLKRHKGYGFRVKQA